MAPSYSMKDPCLLGLPEILTAVHMHNHKLDKVGTAEFARAVPASMI